MTDKAKFDVYQTVTDAIVRALESGQANPEGWTMPWDGRGGSATPLRVTGQPYQGINSLILWCEAKAKGYTSQYWLTYNGAKEHGGQVRKGEKGTCVVYYGQALDKKHEEARQGDEDQRFFRFARAYWVFNAAQIDGLPERFYQKQPERVRTWTDNADLDAFVAGTGVRVIEGGAMAAYSPTDDTVRLPARDRFKEPAPFYSVAFHELTHSTGASHRVGRELSTRFGSKAYAAEELIAEMGAAFLCVALDVEKAPRKDHVNYLAHWLQILREDKRAIFTAAAAAQKAADWLLTKAGRKAAPAANEEREAA